MPESSGALKLYVSPAGSDSNTGTLALPFKTVSKALSVATNGTLIYLRGGTYGTTTVGFAASLLASPWRYLRSAPATKNLLYDALQYGLPVVPYLLSTWFLAAGGRWIGRATLGLTDVAEFTLASQLAAIINLLGRSAYEAWAPRGFAAFAAGHVADGLAYFRSRASRTLLVTGAAAMATELAIATLIPDFAPSYRPVIILFPMFAVGSLLDVACLLAHNVLMGLKRTRAIGVYTTAGVLSFAILGSVFSWVSGLWGLAAAYVCAYAIQWSLAMRALRALRDTGTFPAVAYPLLESVEQLPDQPRL